MNDLLSNNLVEEEHKQALVEVITNHRDATPQNDFSVSLDAPVRISPKTLQELVNTYSAPKESTPNNTLVEDTNGGK